jgi:hypothetical protein
VSYPLDNVQSGPAHVVRQLNQQSHPAGEKIMPWQYDLNSAGGIGDVLPKMHNFIKGLNKHERMSCKAETADAMHDQARGVVFYNPDVEYSAVPDMPGGTWSMQSWSNVDPLHVLDKVATKLNELSKAQAFYAKVVYSDAKYQPATCAVFWPEPS